MTDEPSKVRLSVEECGGQNVAAFMAMIAHAEGVERFSVYDGYDVIVGGTVFDDFRDHPRKLIPLSSLGIKSSAAGRYQFLARTWDDCRKRLGAEACPDFSPRSQDRACVLLLRQCGAWSLLRANRFDDALNAARTLWASLPGAGYGQREHKADELRAVYISAGGNV